MLTTRALKTLEERTRPDVMRDYVVATRRAVGKFWRMTPWGQRVRDVSEEGRPTRRARRDTLYIVGLEVGPGGMVHAHLAVYGEFVPKDYLRALWRKACPVGGFVNVQAMRGTTADSFRQALREVLKYVTKGDKEPGVRAERAAAVECAFRGIRRIEMAGAIRFVPNVTAKDVATASRECEACGGSRSWRWRGMRAPDYVRRNRGFGISHVVDDADAEQLRRDDRELYGRKTAARLEERREWERDRRAGGKFYGGSPPPWIDEPEPDDVLEDVTADYRARELASTSRRAIPVKQPAPLELANRP